MAASRPSCSKPRRQGGAVVVELAVVMVLMLLIVAGIIGFGRAFWYADALTKSVRDGARLLSTWPVDGINAGVLAVKTHVVASANAANLSPPLTMANVQVQCLDSSFATGTGTGTCSDGIAPANVRVRIIDFTIDLGAWFPFIGDAGVIDFGSAGLAPQSTMRYLK